MLFEELFGTDLSDQIETQGDLLIELAHPELKVQPTKVLIYCLVSFESQGLGDGEFR
jgi:hypothetical protein